MQKWQMEAKPAIWVQNTCFQQAKKTIGETDVFYVASILESLWNWSFGELH